LLKNLPEHLGFHRYAISTHPDEFVPESPLKKILDPPMTVPLHYFVNSGSFLWAVRIFSFHVWPSAFMLQVT